MHPPLLFDLGGVLIENDMFIDLMEISGHEATIPDLQAMWLGSRHVRAFELGRTSPQDFCEGVVAEFKMDLSPKEFLPVFASWPKGYYQGARKMLARLGENHLIACLSNSNAIHWTGDFHTPFHHAFSSHLIGHFKPDAEAFTHVADTLKLDIETIHFFDDSITNVKAAADLGIQSHHTVGYEALCAQLQSLGFAKLPG
jgi:glucose-1-phosphatase